jgi:hypothetical protein
MVSTLSLEIENKGDCKNIRITDSSFYNPLLPVTCMQLQVKTPGNTVPVEFELENPYFTTVLNANNLKIQDNVPNECLESLPDGIYYIKYSINPNNKLYVEYNYLHNCGQYAKYIDLVCDLFSEKCLMTNNQYLEKTKELAKIKSLIDSSKYLIEYCGNPEGGVDLYNEANELLNKFKSNVFC